VNVEFRDLSARLIERMLNVLAVIFKNSVVNLFHERIIRDKLLIEFSHIHFENAPRTEL
jgi:hypothetical protein